MVKHVVMFKLVPFDSEAAKAEKLQEIKNKMLDFKSIPNVLSVQVGINANPKEVWDLVLECEFKNMEDLKNYIVHPQHVAFGQNVMKPVKLDRACVDYEF